MRPFSPGILAAVFLFCACTGQRPETRSKRTYYVDCQQGRDDAMGSEIGQAWNTLARVNREPLQAGDQVLFRRGTTCRGSLQPTGSGTEREPLRIGAYSEGALPVIDARGSPYALRLNNQQGWEIAAVEFKGGTLSGVAVGCDGGETHNYFRFSNLIIHGVRGRAVMKRRGLLAIAPSSPDCTFSNIEINGVTAFDSTQWAGIVVDGGYPSSRLDEVDSAIKRWQYRNWPPEHKRARDVVVRNSLVHDVAGDGIVIFRAENARIESNLSWNTGMQEYVHVPGQNPNSMWTLLCRNCAIRGNEAFLSETPGVDGGAFDIDWGSDNNVMEYNYGHDNMGYCFSIFGALRRLTTGSAARFNVCVNNGRSARLARRQGDVYLTTWDNGGIDGVEIDHNTFVWNPPLDTPLFRIVNAESAGPIAFRGARPRYVRNNLAISTVPTFQDIRGSMEVQNNFFWLVGDANAPLLDPLLRPLPGSPAGPAVPISPPAMFDTFRRPILPGEPASVGALQPADRPLPAALRGPKILRAYLNPAIEESRRLLLSVRSADHQFGPLGLKVEIRLPHDAPRNLPYDWHFHDLPHSFVPGGTENAALELANPDGSVVIAWPSAPMPAEIGLALRCYVGNPVGSLPIDYPFGWGKGG